MKTQTITIGSGFDLPENIVTGKVGIVGRTGSGKTTTAVVLAEQLIARGLAVAIVDPQGDWWGLRSKYSIAILGGEHGDVPLEPTGGAIAADFVIKERIPVLLDLFTFGEAEMVRFAMDFAKQLWTHNRGALHVFLDEADLFAPQRAQAEKARCLGAWQNVCRRGRSRGLGLTMLSQRTAVINKDLLTQADPLFVHRMTAPQDLAAIDGYLTVHGIDADRRREILREITQLAVGECYVLSPGELGIEPTRVKVNNRKSFDSSATPAAGEVRQAPKSMADVDLGKLNAAMAATIEAARTSDPKYLKQRIAQLEQDLRRKSPAKALPAPTVDKAAIASAARKAAIVEVHRSVLPRIRKLSTRHEQLGKALADAQGELTELAKLCNLAKPEALVAPIPAAPANEPPPAKAPRLVVIDDPQTRGDLTGVQQRVLDAIAWWTSIGVDRPDTGHVALVAGYTNTGSKGFRNSISALRLAGLVSGSALTPAGRAAAQFPTTAATLEALHSQLLSVLSGVQQRMLQIVIAETRIDRAQLQERMGYTNAGSKGFRNALSSMRSMGFVEYEGQDVVATPLVFPEGLT